MYRVMYWRSAKGVLMFSAAAVSLCFPLGVHAQYRAVTVSTEPNAIVWLDNVRFGTTDKSGALTIKTVGVGAHSLRVRADGFKEKTQPLTAHADRKLFKPLGISRYEWEFTPQKVPNTAGGLRLTSLDLAKYGQLYKNGGKWKGKQVIPRKWVDKTLTNYLNIPYDSAWHYGYLFWNITFKVEGRPYQAYYATGNGGNKIFIFKNQPLVVVITATAYNRPYAHPQAGKIMEKYILPAIVAK